MGKSQVTKKNRGICATSILHGTTARQHRRRLINARRIRKEVQQPLLERIGKSTKDFDGNICVDCIYMISPLYASTFNHELNLEQHIPLHEANDSTLDTPDMEIEDQDLEPDLTSQQDLNIEPKIVLSLVHLRRDIECLDPEIRALLAYELAAVERSSIRQDAANLTKTEYRDLNALSEVCNAEYLGSRNKVLVHFLSGLWTGKDEQAVTVDMPPGYRPLPVTKPSEIYKIAKVTEACMGLTKTINILPFHFRELVLLYSFTRSRTALMLMSSTAPHGSYQTARAWLDNVAATDDHHKLPTEKGDLLGAFDNNQVMLRRWNISVNNKAACSVITMVMFMKIDPEGTLQFQEELKPSNWMWQGLTTEKKESLKRGGINAMQQLTRYKKHYHPWLTSVIQQVAREQRMNHHGQCTDAVDESVVSKHQAATVKTCTDCGYACANKRKQKCPECKGSLSSVTAANDEAGDSTQPKTKRKKGDIRVLVNKMDESTVRIRYERSSQKSTEYDHLQQHHPEQPPEVIIGEPIFLNPCSYEAVTQVFRNIGKQAGIRRYGGAREWLGVVCDGLPYVMGYQIIERTFVCQLCGVSVHGSAESESHQKTHRGDCAFTQEFDWLLLQPGPGHIEINMLKSFVKFSWPVFWEGMVEVFDFHSENAKRTAQNVSDHHKGMTLARIARDSFAKELVLPYVRHQFENNDKHLSVAGFQKFVLNKVKSPTYLMMCDLTFIVLDSIFLYRAGLRCGDVEMMDAGRAFYSSMWSARCHPMYRQLSAYDTIMTACMPAQVLDYINKTKSFNLSGIPYSGEGADFKLEEVNRNVQHWLPSVPKDKDWENACRNQPKLAKLRRQALEEMDLKDPKGSPRGKPDTDPQVLSFRTAVRESAFLHDYDKEGPIMSFGNEPLDGELVHFVREAAKKQSIFMTGFFEHKENGGMLKKKAVPFNETPIFVAPHERTEFNNIRSKTIADCTTLIWEKIDAIEDVDMRINFAEAFEFEVLAKKGKKQDYIDFFELLEEFENFLLTGDDDSDNSDNEEHE